MFRASISGYPCKTGFWVQVSMAPRLCVRIFISLSIRKHEFHHTSLCTHRMTAESNDLHNSARVISPEIKACLEHLGGLASRHFFDFWGFSGNFPFFFFGIFLIFCGWMKSPRVLPLSFSAFSRIRLFLSGKVDGRMCGDGFRARTDMSDEGVVRVMLGVNLSIAREVWTCDLYLHVRL